jgi:hypothetical protein
MREAQTQLCASVRKDNTPFVAIILIGTKCPILLPNRTKFILSQARNANLVVPVVCLRQERQYSLVAVILVCASVSERRGSRLLTVRFVPLQSTARKGALRVFYRKPVSIGRWATAREWPLLRV